MKFKLCETSSAFHVNGCCKSILCTVHKCTHPYACMCDLVQKIRHNLCSNPDKTHHMFYGKTLPSIAKPFNSMFMYPRFPHSNSLHNKVRATCYIFITQSQELQNCSITPPYLQSACKMHPNEYKQAYIWSSSSWDIMCYFINIVRIFQWSL